MQYVCWAAHGMPDSRLLRLQTTGGSADWLQHIGCWEDICPDMAHEEAETCAGHERILASFRSCKWAMSFTWEKLPSLLIAMGQAVTE